MSKINRKKSRCGMFVAFVQTHEDTCIECGLIKRIEELETENEFFKKSLLVLSDWYDFESAIIGDVHQPIFLVKKTVEMLKEKVKKEVKVNALYRRK